MFFISPLFATILAFLTQTGVLIGYAWFDKFRTTDDPYDCWMLHGARSLAFSVWSGFGLIFVHTFVQVVLLGAYGYAALLPVVAGSVLVAVAGITYIVGAVLVAPSWKGLVAFGAMVLTFVYAYYIRLPNATDIDYVWMLAHVIVGFGTLLVLWVLERVVRHLRASEEPYARFQGLLWEKRAVFRRVVNLKTNLVLWVLLTVEVLLNQSGYSLLVWI